MLDVDLSVRDFDGRAVVALRGELDLAGTPGVASHLIAAVAACGPSVIVDLAGLEGIGYAGPVGAAASTENGPGEAAVTCPWQPRNGWCAGCWRPLA